MDQGNGEDVRWERLVPGQELAVLACEDVIRDRRDRETGAQLFAKGEHKRCFSGAYGSVQFLVSIISPSLSSPPLLLLSEDTSSLNSIPSLSQVS